MTAYWVQVSFWGDGNRSDGAQHMNALKASEFSIHFITVNFMYILTQSKEGKRKERKQKERERTKKERL